MVEIDYSGVFYLLKKDFQHTTGARICAVRSDESKALSKSKKVGYDYKSSFSSGGRFRMHLAILQAGERAWPGWPGR